jgi:hypothetical protein
LEQANPAPTNKHNNPPAVIYLLLPINAENLLLHCLCLTFTAIVPLPHKKPRVEMGITFISIRGSGNLSSE